MRFDSIVSPWDRQLRFQLDSGREHPPQCHESVRNWTLLWWNRCIYFLDRTQVAGSPNWFKVKLLIWHLG
eukprot:gene26044-biopygen13270